MVMRMSPNINLFLALVAAFLTPMQAIALRCAVPPDPLDRLNAVRLAPHHMIIAYGTFSGVPSGQTTAQNFPSATYVFDGVLFRDGQASPADPGTIVHSTNCEPDIWCNRLPIHFKRDQTYLVIVGQNPATGALGVYTGLCSSSLVLELERTSVTELATCLSHGTCTQADLETAR